MSSEDGFVTCEMIYAGRRLGRNAKDIHIVFYSADDPTQPAIFDTTATVRRFRKAIIGGRYQMERKESSFRLTTDYQGPANDDRIVEWVAADRAVDVAIRSHKLLAEERAKGQESLSAILKPVRELYQRTDHVGRLALEVVLLHELRR